MLFVKLKNFLVVIVFVVLFKSSLLAIPFVPDIYGSIGSVGLLNKENKVKSEFVVNLGVRPIKLPLLSGFRGEISYSDNFNKNRRTETYGGTIYYDILRFIPIVNPYFGAGIHKSKSNIGGDNYDGKLLSLNVGVTASLLYNLDFFVEYRAMNESFASFFKSSKSNLERKDIILGIRYYFL